MSRPVCLITGASYGIGAAISTRLAAAGFDLVLTAERAMTQTASECRQAGARCHTIVADLREPHAAAEIVASAVRLGGQLDAIVNNAGRTLERDIIDTSVDDLHELIQLNVEAVWLVVRAGVPELRKRGGHVVNISSLHARLGLRGHSVYAATKGAIEALTRELAVELAGDRIRVNAVQPGLIAVERICDDPQSGRAEFTRFIPEGRLGTVSEVAEVVAFLLGPGGAYVNGAIIPVDGGLSAAMAIGAGNHGGQPRSTT